MTTGYRDPVTATRRGENAKPWKLATLALGVSTAIFAFLYAGGKPESHSMAPMAKTMRGAHYDHGFISMMIPHHQQAIDEANMALREAQHPELKQMARDIINSQQAEIEQMKKWRKQWYGE